MEVQHDPTPNLPDPRLPGATERRDAEDLLDEPAIKLIVELRRKPSAAARETGTPKATVYAWLRRIREDGYADKLPPSLRRGAGLDQGADLLGQRVGLHSYPVFGSVPAGLFEGYAVYDDEPSGTFETDLKVVARPPRNFPPFGFKVSGDSMTNLAEPHHFPHDSLVLVDPNLKESPGDFVVVVDLETGAQTLKQIKWAKLPEMEKPGPILCALNPDPKFKPTPIDHDRDRFQVVGVVVDSKLPSYRRGPTRRR